MHDSFFSLVLVPLETDLKGKPDNVMIKVRSGLYTTCNIPIIISASPRTSLEQSSGWCRARMGELPTTTQFELSLSEPGQHN